MNECHNVCLHTQANVLPHTLTCLFAALVVHLGMFPPANGTQAVAATKRKTAAAVTG